MALTFIPTPYPGICIADPPAADLAPLPVVNDAYARAAWANYRARLLDVSQFATICRLPEADALNAAFVAADAQCVALGLPTRFDETGLAVRE